VSLPAALALLDAAVGVYLLWYALRRQRANRAHLAFVGVVLIGCAAVLGYLALPEDEPGRLPPAPGELV
jgi:hydrogenase/urease accessory protein HupE